MVDLLVMLLYWFALLWLFVQNHVDEAMEMYQELHKWDDAIIVAEAKVNDLGCQIIFSFLDNVVVLCSSRITKSNTHTHPHPFNGLFSGTTQVSRYQKGKTNLEFY